MVARRELPVAEVAARYIAGVTLKTLAADYDVAVGTVRDRLKEAGVAARPRGAPRLHIADGDLVQVVETYGSARQAARVLGVSRSTVQRRLHRVPA